MPFARPTLSQLLLQVAADIASAIPGADALLRFSNLATIGKVSAGFSHSHYGYQDWIALQSVPFTATDEFLEAWAALKGVVRKPATVAGALSPGVVTFTNCTPGVEIAGAIPMVRGDGVPFIVTVGGIVDGGGNVAVSVAAVDAGSDGNCAVGIVLTLGVSIAGIQSSGNVTTAITGGTEAESDTDLRNRMLGVYADPPQGGAAGDYVKWAREVAGVTRAWCRPNGAGAGTVIVYFMMDDTEVAHGGFPQGTNGTAAAETRPAPHATGDQLLVADYIFPRQPVTALVYSAAPDPNAIAITINGIAGVSGATKTAIQNAVDDAFFREASPGGVYLPDGGVGGSMDLDVLETAIASVPGTAGFIITAPVANITSAAGALPVRGVITYT